MIADQNIVTRVAVDRVTVGSTEHDIIAVVAVEFVVGPDTW